MQCQQTYKPIGWSVLITFKMIILYLIKIGQNSIEYCFFQLGNHDQKRIAERFGYGRVDLLNILLQTLPGIAITYYVSIRVIEFVFILRNL